jgi:short-subunit dehydrogenase
MAKVIILGATSPIARILAMRFAQDGASVYLAARDAGEAARIASDISVRTGAIALSGAFDAADFASHPDFIRRAAEELGGLDGVVLCFGTLGDEDAAQIDPDAALATLHQNFTGAVSLMTLAGRRLEEQKQGFMIVIGSVAGDRGRAKNYVYGAAKGGLHTFTQGLRGRMARVGVHVMTVKLGTVDTRMTWGREGTLLTVPPEKAANAIYAAYLRKAEVVYVPWFWRPIMGIVKLVPERFFKRTSF